jgi:predicted nucleic-acid-binding protein
LDSIDELHLIPVLQFENPTIIAGFISEARATNLDFSDLLIAQSAMCSGCESVVTFEKKASKSGFFELLK